MNEKLYIVCMDWSGYEKTNYVCTLDKFLSKVIYDKDFIESHGYFEQGIKGYEVNEEGAEDLSVTFKYLAWCGEEEEITYHLFKAEVFN